MEICLPYILRVAIMMMALYIIYFTLLRKMKSFLFNRIYLSGAMLISFIIPIFTFPINIVTPTEIATFLPPIPQIGTIQSDLPVQTTQRLLSEINWTGAALLIFFIGCVASSIRIIAGHLRIRKIVRSSSSQSLLGYSVQVTDENLPPFTYFRKSIIPSNILDSRHLQTILCHEHIHARELHCIDLYLAEILCILQWFNPAAWSFRKAIRDNLEFLTDNLTVHQISRQEYQLGMVALASRSAFSTLPSISNQSQLKKRIVMLNRRELTKFPWGKLFIITPIIAVLTIVSCGKMNILDSADDDKDAIVALQNKIESGEKILSYGGEEKSAKNILFIVDGQKYPPGTIDLKDMNTADIESITVLSNKAASSTYGEEAKGGVIIITTKSSSSVTTKLPNETKVAEKPETASIRIRPANSVSDPMNNIEKQLSGKIVQIKDTGNSDTVISAATGRISEVSNIEDLLSGKIVNIRSTNGTNNPEGSIVIRGRDEDSQSINITGNKNPLYVVDGVPRSSIDDIEPDSIKSITVLKDKAAIALYGEAAKDGIIFIFLK